MNHPHTLTRKKTGLVVIDFQEKFAPVIQGFDEIAQNIVRLVLGCQIFKIPIIVTEQYPQGLGPTIDIVRRQFDPFEPIVKEHFSCVQDDQFAKRLAKLGLENVIVCGVESHICINQTVLGLLAKKLIVHVAVDAIGARKGIDHRMAMEKMMGAGAIPASAEMLLYELAEKSGTPEFKDIQRMVRKRLKWSVGGAAPTPPPALPQQAPQGGSPWTATQIFLAPITDDDKQADEPPTPYAAATDDDGVIATVEPSKDDASQRTESRSQEPADEKNAPIKEVDLEDLTDGLSMTESRTAEAAKSSMPDDVEVIDVDAIARPKDGGKK
jgi:nicotinamidase-related amidase